MTNNSQVTEDQHIIPRFYLKRFANEKNFLQVMDSQKKVLPSQAIRRGMLCLIFLRHRNWEI